MRIYIRLMEVEIISCVKSVLYLVEDTKTQQDMKIFWDLDLLFHIFIKLNSKFTSTTIVQTIRLPSNSNSRTFY